MSHQNNLNQEGTEEGIYSRPEDDVSHNYEYVVDGQDKKNTQESSYGVPQDADNNSYETIRDIEDNIYETIGNGNNTNKKEEHFYEYDKETIEDNLYETIRDIEDNIYETIGNGNNTNKKEEHFYEYDKETIEDNLYETIRKKEPGPPPLPPRGAGQIDNMIRRNNSSEFQNIVTEIGVRGESKGFNKGRLQKILGESNNEIENKGSSSLLDTRVQVLEKALKDINKAEKKLAKKESKNAKLMQKVDKKDNIKDQKNHINQIKRRSWVGVIVGVLASSAKNGVKTGAKKLAQGIKKRFSSSDFPEVSSSNKGALRKTKSLGDIEPPKANETMEIRKTQSLSDLSNLSITGQDQENNIDSLTIPEFTSPDSFDQGGHMGNHDGDKRSSEGNFNIKTTENNYVEVKPSDQSPDQLFSMKLGNENKNNATQSEENTGGITLSAGGNEESNS